MRTRDTKAELMAAGMHLFALQGYSATGIDAVLKMAGVPKGSFYHHFGSKEEFGVAVIAEFGRRFTSRLDVFLSDDSATPLERIRIFLQRGLERLAEHKCTVGCLIGDLGQEVAASSERLREQLDAILFSWKERFAKCIADAQLAGELPDSYDPLIIAGFILSAWEGAVLSAKVMKSPRPVEELIDTLFATVLRKP